jgi:transcriptional regulator
MYVPPHFRIDDPATLAAFMARNAFATLVSVHGDAPFATHLPLLVDGEGDGLRLTGHMARANPQWQSFADGDVLAIFAGPHAYVSPSWYGNPKSVPTWNYATVHAYGHARAIDDRAQVEDVLRRLTEREEEGMPAPWGIDRLPDDYLANMMGGIVAFEIVPSRVEGKFKLSQNRPRDDQETVARELAASASETARATAELMRETLGV